VDNANVTTTDMRFYETIHIGAPIKNAVINSDIAAAAPFRALSVQFPNRAAAVLGAFSWGE
jgi:hypothetical protein